MIEFAQKSIMRIIKTERFTERSRTEALNTGVREKFIFHLIAYFFFKNPLPVY
jgi:hypothetical protein